MINSLSKFIKNISFNMVADLSTRASKSLLLILISHFLGVSFMGALSIALTYLGFGILFSNWGFGNLITREIARDHSVYNKFFGNYGILRILFAGIAILIINLVVPFLSYSENTISVIRIISFSLIATTIIKLYYSVFVAFEDLKNISIIFLVVNILRLIISFIIVIFNGTIINVAIIYSLMEYVSLLLSTFTILRFLPKLKIEINLKFAISEIGRALPFFWIGILLMLDTRAEIIILSLYFNEIIVGYYTAASTILGGVTLFSEAIRNAVFPILFRYQQSSQTKLKELVLLLGKYILIITLPISIVVFFFSSEIIQLLFGDSFELSILMLRIIIWSFISYSLTVVLSGLLMAHDKEKLFSFSLLISGVLTIILDLILAPVIGSIGIAIVRLLTSFIMFLICNYYHIHLIGYGLVERSVFLKTLLGSIIMLIATFLLSNINKWLAVSLGLTSFISVLLITRVILKRDILLWRNVISELFSSR